MYTESVIQYLQTRNVNFRLFIFYLEKLSPIPKKCPPASILTKRFAFPGPGKTIVTTLFIHL